MRFIIINKADKLNKKWREIKLMGSSFLIKKTKDKYLIKDGPKDKIKSMYNF